MRSRLHSIYLSLRLSAGWKRLALNWTLGAGLILIGIVPQAQASERCEIALQDGSKSDASIGKYNLVVQLNQQQPMPVMSLNAGAAALAPILEEFVTLVANSLEQADSPLRATILKALLQTKHLELTQKFGPITANQFLAEIQGRVQVQMSGGLEGSDGNHDENQSRKSRSSPSEQNVKVFQPLKRTVFQHSHALNSALFSPNGTQILTASDNSAAKLWDIKTGQLLASLKGHDGAINSVAFSPDGDHVLTASGDGTAKLWDSYTGRLVYSFEGTKVLGLTFKGHSDWVRSAVFAPNGTQILTASDDKTAKLWDINTGQLLTTFKGHNGPIKSAVFSPDGSQVLSTAKDGTAKLWDAETGKLIHTFKSQGVWIISAIFSPDGNTALTASEDKTTKTTKLWSIKTGELLLTFPRHSEWINSAIFSPDGSQILTANGDGTAKLWDSKAGQLLQTFVGHDDWVRSAVFSPDGTKILTASDDNTAKLWDSKTGQSIYSFQGMRGWGLTFDGHADRVISAIFSPDGSQILTASDDYTAILWDLYQTITIDGNANRGKLLPGGSDAK